MKYRIPEPGTTISGFVDNKKNHDRPTLDFFDMCQKTHIYFFWVHDACSLYLMRVAIRPV